MPKNISFPPPGGAEFASWQRADFKVGPEIVPKWF
jgi:hypothetical protein